MCPPQLTVGLGNPRQVIGVWRCLQGVLPRREFSPCSFPFRALAGSTSADVEWYQKGTSQVLLGRIVSPTNIRRYSRRNSTISRRLRISSQHNLGIVIGNTLRLDRWDARTVVQRKTAGDGAGQVTLFDHSRDADGGASSDPWTPPSVILSTFHRNALKLQYISCLDQLLLV